MALSYKQTKLVRDTIPILHSSGEQIATIFYTNMLAAHPSLANLFNQVNQDNGRQPRALTAVILSFAANINHTSELIPKLERVCQKHCSLGIEPAHYDIVGRFLLAAFGQVLGPGRWTAEVRQAWERAYGVLAGMLVGREKQLYGDFDARGWRGWREFAVAEKVVEGRDVFSFRLVPVDGRRLPSFLPGQYVSLQMQVPETKCLQSRQYSLSDAPRPDHYRITVKRDYGSPKPPPSKSGSPHAVPNGTRTNGSSTPSSYFNPGVISNLLIDTVHAGHVVSLSHPAGEFFLDPANTSSLPLVLISAGVGVAPMISILNAVVETQPSRLVGWVHGARGMQAPFEEHVRGIKVRCPGLRVHFFRTGIGGTNGYGNGNGSVGGHGGGGGAVGGEEHRYRVDLGRVGAEDLFLRNGGTEYMVCGPEQFMLEMKEFLVAHGVDEARIKFELFSTGDLEFNY